jgi:hypothetical protein
VQGVEAKLNIIGLLHMAVSTTSLLPVLQGKGNLQIVASYFIRYPSFLCGALLDHVPAPDRIRLGLGVFLFGTGDLVVAEVGDESMVTSNA